MNLPWFCVVPIVIVLIFGYIFAYALCKTAANADAHIDMLERERYEEGKK